jgi:cytochrome c biogenesis factor
MQYAPAVTDRSAEIYAQGANNATNIRAQGQANFQNSLTSSFNTAMGMVNKRIEKNETDNAKMEQSMASGQAMMSLSDNYGEQGQNFKMSLGKALEDTKGNPDKMSGAVMAHAAEFENMQKQQTAAKTYEALGNAYAGKAAATAAAKANAPMKMNSESIRSMVTEAKAAGFTDDAIKAKLGQQYGEWAVRSVYPPQNQGIWTGQ